MSKFDLTKLNTKKNIDKALENITINKKLTSILDLSYIKDKKIILSVSGGVDSMLMLKIIYDSGIDFEVLNFDHNLRKESLLDTYLVEKYAEKLNKKIVKIKLNVSEAAKDDKKSIETKARELRYAHYEKYMNDGYYILLAHNFDDFIESQLMHIARGSGINGLISMQKQEGRIIRPLIELKKEQIYDLASKYMIPYREDKSNKDNKYKRNLFRNKIIPAFKESGFDIYKSAKKLSEIALIYKEYFESLSDVYCNTFKDEILISDEVIKNKACLIIIKTIFSKHGIDTDLNMQHYRLVKDLFNMQRGSSFYLPNNFIIIKEQNGVKVKKRSAFKSYNMNVKEAIARGDIIISKLAVSDINLKENFFVSENIFNDNLIIRHREKGDLFIRFNGSTVALSDYLINKKIENTKKDDLFLIADGKNVLAVLGLEIGSKLKVESDFGYKIKIGEIYAE